MDLSVELRAVGAFAVVAGSRDHHDSRINQRTRGATDGIILIGTDRRGAQTHVDNANVVFLFVARIGGANGLWLGRRG